MIKSQLEKILDFEIEATGNPDFGDYTSNVAMTDRSLITVHGSPKKAAEAVVEKLKSNKYLSNFVDKIDIAGPGFINFWLTRSVLVNELGKIQKEEGKYGSTVLGSGKTVIIDYSSPNIAKPFGIGHLRSTIIGQALYNLYTSLGYTVVGDNHLGDWGTQFGKLLYMVELKKVTDFDIAKLEELYVEFHKLAETDKSLEESAREWFKKLEDGDSSAKSIWQKCVDVSMQEFDKVYKLLGVKIDFAFGESYYESEMKQLMIDENVKKHLTKGEDGAEIIDLTKEGIPTPLMFLKSDGATTYATRDLATIKFRTRKWNPDIVIYEVGAEQALHFKQVFAAAQLLGLANKSTQFIHTAHGLYLAPDGKKFATRKGNTIKLEEVLDEAIERAKKLGDVSDEVAKQVGIGAIKYFDLMHSVQSNVVFEWEKVMNMDGNSGPYLQYTVARTNSVLAKTTFKDPVLQGGYSNLNNEELSVLRALIKYPETIEQSANLFSPNLLCNYLYDLASKFNAFYNKHKILVNSEQSTVNGSLSTVDGSQSQFRLVLTAGVSQVLKNGLKLLGINTPERM